MKIFGAVSEIYMIIYTRIGRLKVLKRWIKLSFRENVECTYAQYNISYYSTEHSITDIDNNLNMY